MEYLLIFMAAFLGGGLGSLLVPRAARVIERIMPGHKIDNQSVLNSWLYGGEPE